MAVTLHIREFLLSNKQVKYELMIREKFDEQDSWAVRRSKLKNILEVEDQDEFYPNLTSHLDFESEFNILKSDYILCKSLFEKYGQLRKDQIHLLETLTEHLFQRSSRMKPPNDEHEFGSIRTEISSWKDKMIEYYTKNPSHQVDEPPPSPLNNLPKTNRSSMRRIPLDASLLDSGGGWHQQANANAFHHVNTDPRRRHNDGYDDSHSLHSQRPDTREDRNSTFSVNSSHSSNSQYNTRRPKPIRQSFRPAYSPRAEQHSNEHSWHSANSVTVLKWKFHFSGLTPSEDPKGLELDNFIQRVEDYGRSENISESEILDKIQHLLKGPAEDWYTHARWHIRKWKTFVDRLKKRFASVTGPDAIQQMILQKKQLHGEYTLRFIDQFINLIDKLPYAVSEKRALDWILSGIRHEIAILARTANLRSPDELTSYVKRNFGPHDKYFDRQHRGFNPNSRQFQRNLNALEIRDNENDYMSNSDSDYDEPLPQEVNKISLSKSKKKKEAKSAIPKTTEQASATQNELGVNLSSTQSSNHTCCLHTSRNSCSSPLSHSHSHSPTPFSPGVYPYHCNYNQPYFGQCSYPFMNEMAPIGFSSPNRNHSPINATNQPTNHNSFNNVQNSLPCPYCKGSHSYRACTLPPEQKVKHCFKCGTKDQTTRTCACNSNNQINPVSEMNSNQSNPTHLALLESIPKKVYVESLIYYPSADARPHLSIVANGITLLGLLDTGAHATVFGRDLYESIADWKTDLQPIET